MVAGRGELHLGVLLESMRREGYEFEVGRPQVVTHKQDGKEVEPVEELTIEVPAEHVGAVQMELGSRKAELLAQNSTSKGVTELVYKLPTRGLLGLRNVLLTNTRGTVVMNSLLVGFDPVGPELAKLRNGVLIAWEQGLTTPYALSSAEERGILFVPPATPVYMGQIVGLNSRPTTWTLMSVKKST